MVADGERERESSLPSRPFKDMKPCVINSKLSFVSFVLISLQTSSTFFRRVRSFWMKVVSASGWIALSSDRMRVAAS